MEGIRPKLVRFIGACLVLLPLIARGEWANAAIVASLEEPNVSATGIALIRGWAFTTTPGASINTLINVYIDGVQAALIPCCSNRGDVKTVYPDAPLLSGFGGVYNYQLLTQAVHTIEAVVTSTAGEQVTLAKTFAVIRPSVNFSFLDSVQYSNGTQCQVNNSPDPPDFPARLTCTNLRAVRGALTEICPGSQVFQWDRASQGFKLVFNACAIP